MKPLDVALQYMGIFFSGQDLDRLYNILTDDVKFSGPFYQFESAQDYIESLQSDPPVECQYTLVQVFENGPFVNVIYQFSKPYVCAHMSQLFEVHNDKITKVLLIFDTGKFIQEEPAE